MRNTTTMLIVDDSRVSRMMIRTIVSEARGDWVFIEAGDGGEALERVDGTNVDLMTIDMNMPGMDGLTLAAKLRDRFPSARISLVTANIQDSVQRRAHSAGLGFIPKPITNDKILEFVNGGGS